MISGQLSAGYLQTNQPKNFNGIWATYHFSLGAGCIFRLHPNHDLGLSLKALSFAKEINSIFFSGSSIMLRYRFKSILTEFELASPSQLFIGWASEINNPYHTFQSSLVIKYLYSNKFQFGFQMQHLPFANKKNIYEVNEKTWQVRLFFGSYF